MIPLWPGCCTLCLLGMCQSLGCWQQANCRVFLLACIPTGSWSGRSGLATGAGARERPFPGNRWYVDAITAAVDCPELAHFLGGEDADSSGPCMGSFQVCTCLQYLLIGSKCSWRIIRRCPAALHGATAVHNGIGHLPMALTV